MKRIEKNKNKKLQLSRALEKSVSTTNAITTIINNNVIENENVNARKLSSLQLKMQKKLAGAKFRFINQQLYTSNSSNALTLFQSQPEMFDIYHEGFRTQVQDWPINPVDIFISYLKSCKSRLVVADLGCGDAKIASTLKSMHKIHSFDLVSHTPDVVACDIAHTPLQNESIDLAIFSLSLMGTNWMDFIHEAHRILKFKGELRIAEVTSRFEDLKQFLATLKSIGFECLQKDEQASKMFILMTFKKVSGGSASASKRELDSKLLKPCIYKKR